MGRDLALHHLKVFLKIGLECFCNASAADKKTPIWGKRLSARVAVNINVYVCLLFGSLSRPAHDLSCTPAEHLMYLR